MEYYNRTLCVTYAELTGGKEPVMKPCTLRQNAARGNIVCLRRGGGEGGVALYAWASIPAKYRDRFTALRGDPEEQMRKAMARDRMRIDAAAREWYAAYTYADRDGEEQHLSERLVEEYTVNASALEELVRLMGERQALRSSLQASGAAGAWDVVFRSSERLREVYGHTLPGSASRLKAKIRDFRAEGYASLVSGKVGNSNTLKLTEAFGRQIIALKRSRVPVYTDRQLWEKANEIAAARGWKPIRSLSGLKKWLASPAVEPLWWDAVHGEQSSRQRYNRKQRTELPARRDSLWYGDGTRLNLYYRDEGGKVRTTCVYEVIDAATEVMLGYWISDTEDYEAQYHAYRMAVQVSGHRPYEIVHDNQGGHKRANSKGMLDKICRVHRTAMPYNGESKTIEGVFGRFQSQVLHKDWRFTGQNVTARKDGSRPNIEFIEANKDRLYTLDELKAAYAGARKEWNEMRHPATGERRIDMYNSSVNEDTPAVTPRDMVEMFWVFTDKPSTFTDQGIQITVKGERRRYEVFSAPGVPDHEWRRRHTYERFTVAYDPYDFGSVRLYSKAADGSLRFERVAEPYIVIHRALQDQQAGEARFIRQEMEANALDRAERVAAGREIEWAHGVAPEQHGLSSPELKGADAELRRQIERRVEKYSRAVDVRLGRVHKDISMADWREALCPGDPGGDEEAVLSLPSRLPELKMAGKL